MHKKVVAVAFLSALMTLVACQQRSSAPPEVRLPSNAHTALATMERIAIAANSCWFKSNDPAFKAYRLAPELNSFSGRPRILVVPAKNPGDRPLLVVHAEGQPAKVEVFGPLLHQGPGDRIARDVNRWRLGQKGC